MVRSSLVLFAVLLLLTPAPALPGHNTPGQLSRPDAHSLTGTRTPAGGHFDGEPMSVVQTDWTGGKYVAGPVSTFGTAFYDSDSITYNVSGQISAVACSANLANWVKHTIERNPGIDGHGGLYHADFDGDGDYDLAGWMSLACTMRFYQNFTAEHDSVGYKEVASYPAPPSAKGKYGQTWAGDINGDGRPDVAVVCSTRVFWYENLGDFNFALRDLGPSIHTCGGVEGADVNLDGLVDLVVGDRPLEVWYQEPGGTFRPEYVWQGRSYKTLVGNVNNDEWPDLLAEDNLFINSGGTYPSTPTWSAGLSGPDGIWIRDFNNDGLPDLLMCDQWASTPGIYWYENLGDATDFRRHTILKHSTASRYGDGACAEDVDADGRADVIGSYSRVAFFRQVTPDSFALVVLDTITDSHWIRTGNLDYRPGGSDVDIDIMVTGRRQFAWYENRTQSQFSSDGWLVSSILDAGHRSAWLRFVWEATAPQGTELVFQVRTGPTPDDCANAEWSEPFEARAGVELDSTDIEPHTEYGDRYFQYRVQMSGTRDATPALYSVRVVFTRYEDIGITKIEQPIGFFSAGENVVPLAIWRNNGDNPADFDAYCSLINPDGERVYAERVPISALAPGQAVAPDFTSFNVGNASGWWVVRCSTWAHNDVYRGNDSREADFHVSATPPPWHGWVEVAAVPSTSSGSNVRAGAWLASAADGIIFAAKGGKKADFFEYDADAGTRGQWRPLAPIPSQERGSHKPPSKGCRGTSDGGGNAFMVKGNNTLGFWHYDAVRDSWLPLPEVPPGAGHKVKGGSDLAYHHDGDTGWVYLLKGGKTEFYKYNVAAGRWDALPNAPFGGGRARYDEGSFLVADGAGLLYLHQAKYLGTTNHFMFAFDLAADTWHTGTLQGLPIWGLQGGRLVRKKSKEGACGAWRDGGIYALKGGNTQQFHRYLTPRDTWVEMDTMPSFGSSMKKKRVKDGGDIVRSLGGDLFAFKGNKTCEFWRYVMQPESPATGGQTRDGVAADAVRGTPRIALSPAVTTDGRVTLHLAPGPDGMERASLSLFDAAGRCVLNRLLFVGGRETHVPLDLRGLPAGVYLTQVNSGNASHTQKLVVQK